MKIVCPKCKQQYELSTQSCKSFTCFECNTVIDLENKTIHSSPSNTAEKFAWFEHRKKIWIVVACFILCLLGGCGLIVIFSSDSKNGDTTENSTAAKSEYDRTEIMKAISQKDTIRLTKLLKEFDAAYRDASGNSLLMEGVRSGNTDIVQIFLASGYQINLRNNKGETVLLEAARRNDLAMVQFLLKNGAYVRTIDKNADTVWGIAAENGFVDIIRFLCKRNQGLIESSKLETCLIRALKNKHFACVEELLSQYEPAVLCSLTDKDGNTLPMISIQVDYLKIFQQTLFDENINSYNNLGQNALYFACLSSNTKFFDALVAKNVSFTYSNIKYSPVFAALKGNNDYVLKYLVSKNLVDTNLQDDGGNNCLMIAVQNNNTKSLQILLETNKFDPFAKNKAGQTAYDIAVKHNKTAMKDLLFQDMEKRVLTDVKKQVHSWQARSIANRVFLRHLNNLLEKNTQYHSVVTYVNDMKRNVIRNIIRDADNAVNKAMMAARKSTDRSYAISCLENAIRNNPEATNLERAKKYCEELKKTYQYEQERQKILQAKRKKYNRMSEREIRREVTNFLNKWLTDMRLDKDTSSYWTNAYLAKTFFSVKSWQVIGVRDSWSAWENTVIVQVDSSNKGGIPIRNNWKIVVRRNQDDDFQWKISSIIE